MLKRTLLRKVLLIALAGAPMVLASVPRTAQRNSEITNDTAIYQNLHEIRVAKIKSVDFDHDIAKLSAQEKMHREALPLRISAPMERVMKSPYQSGNYQKSFNKPSRFYRNH